MNAGTSIATGRLLLTPVSASDLPELLTLKSDPRVYAQMLGGVRGPVQIAAELAADLSFWARHGVGMWIVRPAEGGRAVGLVGMHERPDGRGIALRFAFTPESRGRGLAREAAGAALRFAHDRAGLEQVVAVTRDSNLASRTVLGAIGMRVCDTFNRGGERMLVFESRATPPEVPDGR